MLVSTLRCESTIGPETQASNPNALDVGVGRGSPIIAPWGLGRGRDVALVGTVMKSEATGATTCLPTNAAPTAATGESSIALMGG